MSVIDVETLLQPLADDQPCGEDLEYDPVFGDLDRAAQGTPERQMGDEVVPAEPPDWKEVKKLSLDLLGRTRDLRVATRLARALVNTDGLPGLASGLELLNGLCERHWEKVHPQLDPDDDNDPTMRVNTLAELADVNGMVADIRRAPLVESRALGRFGLNDIEIATGRIPAPEGVENLPETASIDAAFLDGDLERLQELSEAAGRASGAADGVDSYLTGLLGANSPDLAALVQAAKGAQNALAEQLARRGVGEAPAAEGGAEGAGGAGAEAAAAISGTVNTREDVIRVLDKAIDYFARHEPSSPVPLLLRRAKRLVSKDFLEILRDMAPDGVNQAEVIAGAEREE
ncbi:hypothetical protein ABI59_02570 [Acidobacteria bacterium Mor1]|nr:hypothetical protein ABI59_02570 [Acidobacteria bacterium Mor1]